MYRLLYITSCKKKWCNHLVLLAYSQPCTLKERKKLQQLTFNYTASGLERPLHGSVLFKGCNTQSSTIVPDTVRHTVYNNVASPLERVNGQVMQAPTCHTYTTWRAIKSAQRKSLPSSYLAKNTSAHVCCVNDSCLRHGVYFEMDICCKKEAHSSWQEVYLYYCPQKLK